MGMHNWFEASIKYKKMMENGKEKKSPTHILIQAYDIRQAISYIDEHMKGTMADYEIEAVSDSKLMDVYPYES